jgi:hypothetical protein
MALTEYAPDAVLTAGNTLLGDAPAIANNTISSNCYSILIAFGPTSITGYQRWIRFTYDHNSTSSTATSI